MAKPASLAQWLSSTFTGLRAPHLRPLPPANDDASKSIDLIVDVCCAAIQEGLTERQAEKVDMEAAGEGAKGKKKATKARVEKVEAPKEEDKAEVQKEDEQEA